MLSYPRSPPISPHPQDPRPKLPCEDWDKVASPSDTSLPPRHYPKPASMCSHCLPGVRQESELVSSHHLKPSSILGAVLGVPYSPRASPIGCGSSLGSHRRGPWVSSRAGAPSRREIKLPASSRHVWPYKHPTDSTPTLPAAVCTEVTRAPLVLPSTGQSRG